jgi:hypothetical protein
MPLRAFHSRLNYFTHRRAGLDLLALNSGKGWFQDLLTWLRLDLALYLSQNLS